MFYPAASIQGNYESVEGSAADPRFREDGSPEGLGSVVVIEESPCPRGPIYKSLSLDHKVLEIFKDFQGRILQTVHYV